MTMQKGVITCVLSLLAYMRTATSGSETVWLNEVNKGFETYKKSRNDPDLPNELTFHITRESGNLTLNLKKNHDINPNADIYSVHKMKDGRSQLVKTPSLEIEDVAYYQDIDNGAFMTVRCLKRSNERCDRFINGNIQIGDSSYDLRPEETSVISRNLLAVEGRHGKRYILNEHAKRQRDNLFENEANVLEKRIEQDSISLRRRLNDGQHKETIFPRSNTALSSDTVADLHNRSATGRSRQLKDMYYVEVAVLIGTGVWDLYSPLVKTSYLDKHRMLVKAKLRQAFSHIINGVNLCFKAIEDSTISISVIPSAFIFFPHEVLFPYKHSKVEIVNGEKNIDAIAYLNDLRQWDLDGTNYLITFDEAMLFTSFNMIINSSIYSDLRGIAYDGGVCDLGYRTSIVEVGDYFLTVNTAAHELGHALGAEHDGSGRATACKNEDSYIMSTNMPKADPSKPYSRNPWIFSNCSVEAFKRELKNKHCVHDEGVIYNENEWNKHMSQQPGEVYSLNEQCEHINGAGSRYCGIHLRSICHLMRCTDPKTKSCIGTYFSAARGTGCGQNMWCIEGRCVPNGSK